MNETTAAAANQSSISVGGSYGTLTGIHLGVMAVFAALVILAILYGIRAKHRRVATRRTVEDNAAEAGVVAQPAAPAGDTLPADRRTGTPEGENAPPPPPTPARQDSAVITPPPAPTPVMPAPQATAEPEPATPDAGHDEPIAAAAPLNASPAAEAASPPQGIPAAGDAPVTLLKGLGPKVAARLAELGITTVGQVAALNDDQANALDAELGTFRGRMTRDRWVEQARFLAAGDRAGFEAVFGKL